MNRISLCRHARSLWGISRVEGFSLSVRIICRSAGVLFLGSQHGNSQLLELPAAVLGRGSGELECTVLDEALVDNLAPIHDVAMFEDPPGSTRRLRVLCP